jgi:multiple sugar transport system ATP-binding protein
MAPVVLEHVSKTYPNGVRALSDLNLTIADGEFIVLVGPSGSGKTTTLRLIAGLDRASEGTLRIGGHIVNKVPPRERDVAMVFQRHTLYPHLSVRRNLQFGMEMRQYRLGPLGKFWERCWPPARKRQTLWQEMLTKRVADAAQFLEITELLERKPQQLSGGEQQRVALGRAMVRQPAVFLLDEPLSHLDPPLRSGLRRQLHLLHRRLPATMIHVTHDPVEAMILAERVVVLDGGVVQQVDRPLAVYNEPCNRRVAGFFGWPSMNFIDGVLTSGPDGLGLKVADATLPVPFPSAFGWAVHRDKPVSVGVRPADVRLSAREGDASHGWSGTVGAIEAVGSMTLATVEPGGMRLTAQMNGQPPNEGQAMTITIDWQKAHLFDRDSGQALVHGRPEG